MSFRKKKDDAFESGFDAPATQWTFPTSGSPTVDAFIRGTATPRPVYDPADENKPARERRVIGWVVNQEPTYEECMIQKWRGVDPEKTREAAIESRKAVSLGMWPLTANQVAECVASAIPEYQRLLRRHLGRPDPEPAA